MQRLPDVILRRSFTRPSTALGDWRPGNEATIRHVEQSRVEIEGYSISYFECIAAFRATYCWTSVKARAHMCFVDFHSSTKHVWAPPLTEVQQYSALNTATYIIEIPNRIIFNFCTGLPHVVFALMYMFHKHWNLRHMKFWKSQSIPRRRLLRKVWMSKNDLHACICM